MLFAVILVTRRVSRPATDTVLHCRLNGGGIKRVGKGSRTQKVLDSKQIWCHLAQCAEFVTLLGAMMQVI